MFGATSQYLLNRVDSEASQPTGGEHASKKALNEVKKDTVIKKKKKEQSKEKGANNTEEKIPKSRPNSNDENGNDDELDVW